MQVYGTQVLLLFSSTSIQVKQASLRSRKRLLLVDVQLPETSHKSSRKFVLA